MPTSSITKPAKPSIPKGKSERPARKERFDELLVKLQGITLSLLDGEKLPGVYELRDAMGVSVTTINSALNELEARQVIIRRNGVGIFRSPNAGKRVISLVCDPTFFRSGGGSPFWDMLITEARSRAVSHNELLDLNFSIINSDKLAFPAALKADIAANRISGVLYIGVFKSAVDWIESQGVPVVTFAGPASHEVNISLEAMLGEGAGALARSGRKRIALAMPDFRANEPSHVESFRTLVRDAFRRGLDTGNAPYLDEIVRNVVTLVSEGPWAPQVSTQELGYVEARKWLQLPADRRPDGIVVTDDIMTLGVISAIQDAGLEVGRDIAIASHANAGSATLIGWEDKMIILKIDPAKIASVMFDTLERLIEGDLDVPASVLLRPTVITGHRA
ncbi:MAG TPA: substrate-binding domain-containing protein [Capsulimonadaceae bacterium]|jgi:DNA-binding LacI/PurR family transcriptional regulator